MTNNVIHDLQTDPSLADQNEPIHTERSAFTTEVNADSYANSYSVLFQLMIVCRVGQCHSVRPRCTLIRPRCVNKAQLERDRQCRSP